MRRILGVLVLLVALTGCSGKTTTKVETQGVTGAAPLGAPPLGAAPVAVESAAAEDEEVWLPEQAYDPLEEMNRGIFWFNDKLDVYVAEPIARGYDRIVPDLVRIGLGNFFENVGYPSYLLSDLVQLKFTQAGEHTGRFLINTTIGLFGFLDIAEDFGLPRHREDFGSALAYHGVPGGPYLMLPLLGPSNVRDGIGRIVDTLVHPFSILTYADAGLSLPVTTGAFALELVHTRAGLIEAVETAKESSPDYYLFVQSAYYQYRDGIVSDGKVKRPLDDEDEEFED